MDIEWGLFAVAAGAIVGMIEWAKKLGPRWPTIVWHLALLPLCVGAGLLLPGPVGVRLLVAGLLLLVTQVGYQLLVQGAIGIVRAIVNRMQERA